MGRTHGAATAARTINFMASEIRRLRHLEVRVQKLEEFSVDVPLRDEYFLTPQGKLRADATPFTPQRVSVSLAEALQLACAEECSFENEEHLNEEYKPVNGKPAEEENTLAHEEPVNDENTLTHEVGDDENNKANEEPLEEENNHNLVKKTKKHKKKKKNKLEQKPTNNANEEPRNEEEGDAENNQVTEEPLMKHNLADKEPANEVNTRGNADNTEDENNLGNATTWLRLAEAASCYLKTTDDSEGDPKEQSDFGNQENLYEENTLESDKPLSEKSNLTYEEGETESEKSNLTNEEGDTENNLVNVEPLNEEFNLTSKESDEESYLSTIWEEPFDEEGHDVQDARVPVPVEEPQARSDERSGDVPVMMELGEIIGRDIEAKRDLIRQIRALEPVPVTSKNYYDPSELEELISMSLPELWGRLRWEEAIRKQESMRKNAKNMLISNGIVLRQEREHIERNGPADWTAFAALMAATWEQQKLSMEQLGFTKADFFELQGMTDLMQ